MPMWDRTQTFQLSPHFSSSEFTCSCGVCQKQLINQQFLDMLEAVRTAFGAPIKINSGYRCAVKQEQLRKQGYETAVGISSHELGIAADVSAHDMAALGIAVATVFGPYSIGTAKSFIHVDSRPGGPRRWSYVRS
jgi:uncharacterized protein YcbK (DUF882 family)